MVTQDSSPQVDDPDGESGPSLTAHLSDESGPVNGLKPSISDTLRDCIAS